MADPYPQLNVILDEVMRDLEMPIAPYAPPVRAPAVRQPPQQQKVLTGADIARLGDTPLVPEPTIPGQVGEVFKAIPGAAVSLFGTAAKGLARADPEGNKGMLFNKFRDKLAAVPQMDNRGIANLRREIATSGISLSGEQGLQDTITGLARGEIKPEQLDELLPQPKPYGERDFYQIGQGIEDFASGILPASPGYEESPGRMLGQGLGSVLGGALAAAVGGLPGSIAFFSGVGMGESATNLVEWDKAEKAAGRKGATDEQVALSTLLGMAPGITNVAPIEMLLGRIGVPKPFRNKLANYFGRAGGQSGIEGLQEGFEGVAQNLIAQKTYNPEQSLAEGILPQAATGGATGFVAELIGGALRGRSMRPRRKKETPADTTGVAEEEAALDQDAVAQEPGEQETAAAPAQTPSPATAPEAQAVAGSQGTAENPAPSIDEDGSPMPIPAELADDVALLRGAGMDELSVADFIRSPGSFSETLAGIKEQRSQPRKYTHNASTVEVVEDAADVTEESEAAPDVAPVVKTPEADSGTPIPETPEQEAVQPAEAEATEPADDRLGANWAVEAEQKAAAARAERAAAQPTAPAEAAAPATEDGRLGSDWAVEAERKAATERQAREAAQPASPAEAVATEATDDGLGPDWAVDAERKSATAKQARTSARKPVTALPAAPPEETEPAVEAEATGPAKKAAQPKKPRQKKTGTLIGWLKSKNGIREESGELKARDLNRMPGLVTKKGMFPDDALTQAKEEGFLPQDASLSDLYDAIAERGRRRITDEAPAPTSEIEEQNAAALEEVHEAIREQGGKPEEFNDLEAVAAAVVRGEDVFDALENVAKQEEPFELTTQTERQPREKATQQTLDVGPPSRNPEAKLKGAGAQEGAGGMFSDAEVDQTDIADKAATPLEDIRLTMKMDVVGADESVTVSTRADEALAEVDWRLDGLQKLLECVRK